MNTFLYSVITILQLLYLYVKCTIMDWTVNRVPSRIEQLTPQQLSKYLKKTVVKVELMKEKVSSISQISRCHHLKVTFSDGSQRILFVKLSSSSAIVRLFNTRVGLYGVEVNFFRTFLDQPQILREINCPIAYYVELCGWNYIAILECVSQKENYFTTMVQECSYSLAVEVLKTSAKLHAAFWRNVPKAIDDYPEGRMGIAMEDFTYKQTLKKYNKEISDDMRKIWDCDQDRHALKVQYLRRINKTMIHGDLHLGNTFFDKKSGKCGLYDWQLCRSMHPMLDVTYFLVSSYDGDDLEKHEKTFITIYVDELNKKLRERAKDLINQGVKINQDEWVFNFDEAWKFYKFFGYYNCVGWMMICGITGLISQESQVVGLRRVSKFVGRHNTYQIFKSELDDYEKELCKKKKD
eukprot:TRINITY_DN509_c0_g1_i2.p1 TRINITY_DN509_c0_g1~~TRINITY_DN509_c0_g1_i2.p1  ORF type:complete len:408 (+),score=43.01 TRINITY_DN509_c0_g1_i2:63-1286(+)